MNKYRRHINALCRKHSITFYTGKAYHDYVNATRYNAQDVISPEDPTPTFSDAMARCIAVPCINDRFSYFCALHEVGHILTYERSTQDDYAFNVGKVTKYILGSEYKASVRAIELNEYVPLKYMQKWAVENQWFYISKYEKDWNTKLRHPEHFTEFKISK